MTQVDIKIVGSRNLQNVLLARYLENFLGERARFSILDGWEEFQTWKPGKGSLVLLDFRSLDREDLIQNLAAGKYTEKFFVFAVFNVFPDHHPEILTREMLVYGLRGVFNENETIDQVVRGVKAMLNHELWIPRHILENLLIQNRDIQPPLNLREVPSLTDREREILLILGAGASNKEIADRLFISPHTVRTHLHNLYAKIGVTTRLQAALWVNSNLNKTSHKLYPRPSLQLV